jgi:hypothetical protein
MFLTPDDLRTLTGRAHKPLEKEMNSKEAFTQWLEEWVSPDHLSPSELAAKAWQAALEWATKGQEPVAWLVKTSPDGYPFTENPTYAERHNGQPLYLHPAHQIVADEIERLRADSELLHWLLGQAQPTSMDMGGKHRWRFESAHRWPGAPTMRASLEAYHASTMKEEK